MDAKQWQQLDLNLLRLFVVLNEEQNLSRAAERLYITPSAVSHALKRLRGHFNDTLFERHGSKMRPTPFCKRVYPVVVNHLNGLFDALTQATIFDPDSHSLQLSIAMPDALEQIILPKVVDALGSKAKQLRLDSVVLKRSEMESALHAGDIDFALDIERPLGAPINHEAVISDSFCVLGWQQVHSSPLNQANYLSAAHIGVSRRSQGATVEDVALHKAGFDRNTVLRCQTYHAAIALVRQGMGVLTLPTRLAKSMEAAADLSIEPLPIDLPALLTHFYWHEKVNQDSALSWAHKELLECFESMRRAL